LKNIEIINLPKILDERGNLSFIEEENHIPFKIERTYWIYDVPGGETRGGHAFKDSQEFIVAISGSFTAVLHDGKEEVSFHLNRSYYGLYVPKFTWRRLENFSTNSLALILTDTKFSDESYIRDFEYFKNIKNGHDSVGI
jgi:hypothetical protein